jgi:hypothetical protein
MGEYIINPINLKFDPKDLDPNSDVGKVFADDLARTLWMGIKIRRVASQYFDLKILELADYLKKTGVPETPEKLNDLFSTKIGRLDDTWIEELYPYVSGEEQLEYKVE